MDPHEKKPQQQKQNTQPFDPLDDSHVEEIIQTGQEPEQEGWRQD